MDFSAFVFNGSTIVDVSCSVLFNYCFNILFTEHQGFCCQWMIPCTNVCEFGILAEIELCLFCTKFEIPWLKKVEQIKFKYCDCVLALLQMHSMG